MKSSIRHTITLLALLAYTFSGVLVELMHRHGTRVLLGSQPIVSNHSCGEKEVHIPLDEARHCLACSHPTQRFFAEANPAVMIDASMVCLATILLQTEQAHETDLFHSGMRGPPAA
jgi:hypothetical protein